MNCILKRGWSNFFQVVTLLFPKWPRMDHDLFLSQTLVVCLLMESIHVKVMVFTRKSIRTFVYGRVDLKELCQGYFKVFGSNLLSNC